MIAFEIGQRVLVSNKSRMDRALEGKRGLVIEAFTRPHGYVRLRLDGECAATVLVHPESIEAA